MTTKMTPTKGITHLVKDIAPNFFKVLGILTPFFNGLSSEISYNTKYGLIFKHSGSITYYPISMEVLKLISDDKLGSASKIQHRHALMKLSNEWTTFTLPKSNTESDTNVTTTEKPKSWISKVAQDSQDAEKMAELASSYGMGSTKLTELASKMVNKMISDGSVISIPTPLETLANASGSMYLSKGGELPVFMGDGSIAFQKKPKIPPNDPKWQENIWDSPSKVTMKDLEDTLTPEELYLKNTMNQKHPPLANGFKWLPSPRFHEKFYYKYSDGVLYMLIEYPKVFDRNPVYSSIGFEDNADYSKQRYFILGLKCKSLEMANDVIADVLNRLVDDTLTENPNG